jgi:hypothetical protein
MEMNELIESGVNLNEMYKSLNNEIDTLFDMIEESIQKKNYIIAKQQLDQAKMLQKTRDNIQINQI